MEFKSFKTIAHDQYLRGITHVLVSVSLFCIIFFHSSSSSSSSAGFSFLVHSLKFYLSAIPLHSLEKRWVFLICNGILVIIANTSGFANFPPLSGADLDQNDPKTSPDHHHLHAAPTPQILLLENAEKNDENITEDSSEEDEKEEEETGEQLGIRMEEDHAEEEEEEETGEVQGDEIRIYITEEDDNDADDEFDENFESEENFDPITLEEEEEEEEGMLLEKLSAEELNKKFEDFIRKMKEELWIEAQQQQQRHLVMVK